MTKEEKLQKKIDYLKKENEILKSILKRVQQSDLYELDFDYDWDEELQQTELPFVLDNLILDESKREERFINRGDEYITNDMITLISENYAKLYKKLNCLVYLFPLSNNLENDIDKIYKLATS